MPAALILVTMVEHATTILLVAITVAAFLVVMAHGVKQREIHVQDQVWSTAMAMAFAESSIVEMMVTFFHFATVSMTMILASSADFSVTTIIDIIDYRDWKPLT